MNMATAIQKTKQQEVLDWRQCARWLNRCRIIPDDHTALTAEGNGLQLLQTLMDGVAVCKLLSTLSNGAIDLRSLKDFNGRPEQSQFFCRQNIRVFINLCEQEFHIDKEYLIEPDDLYHATNFGKVIELLSKLSKCERARESEIEGFPSDDINSVPVHDYYNTLTGFNAASVEDIQVVPESNYADITDETNEIVYDSIVHGGTNVSPTQTEVEPTTPRSHCIKEILNTEQHYVELLRMLLDKYKQPLSDVLSKQETEEIFKYLDQLLSIHRSLLTNLNLAVSSTLKVPKLGQVFTKVRDQLLIYGEYCGHVSKAQALVLEMKENDVCKRSKLEECQSQSDTYSKFNLTELLTVPMQRVLKYHLLLGQLCKLTDEDHPEKLELMQAWSHMRELAETINEFKRDLDTISSIDQIQASLLDIDLPDQKRLSMYGRRHIDGDLRVFEKSTSKSKIRYAFLFDKVLLLCKSKGENYAFMNAYHIVNGRTGVSEAPTKKTGKYIHDFYMPIAGNEGQADLIFSTKSDEMRIKWIKAVETALGNVFPPGARENGYHFEMHTFKQTTYCCFCHKLLQGVFYQGYRCRESGFSAHKECLSTNVPKLQPLPKNGGPALMSRTISWPQPPFGPNGTPGTQIKRNTSIASTESSDVSLRRTSTSNSFDAESVSGKLAVCPATNRNSGPSRSCSTGMGGGKNEGTNIWVTAITAYSGEPPPPPLYSLTPQDPITNGNPLSFKIGDRILLTKSPDGSRWLQGRLNDQSGCFPACTVDLPLNVDSPVNALNRQTLLRMGDELDSTSLPLDIPIGSTGKPFQRSTSRQFYSHPRALAPINDSELLLDGAPFGHRQNTEPGFFGEMDRNEAISLLSDCANGTYLVRISKNAVRRGELSLSVVFNFPRHIRIHRALSSDGKGIFYLAKQLNFPSITALIEHYSHTSLNESFDDVNTTLRYPYQRCPKENVLFYARVLFTYDGNTDDKMLSLPVGDLVSVCNTYWDEQGWWQGWLKGRIGLFPKKCVAKESNIMTSNSLGL